MPKKSKSRFPDTLYVVYEPEDDGEGYFVASANLSDHAWPNGKIRAARYVLEQIGDITAEPTFVDVD